LKILNGIRNFALLLTMLSVASCVTPAPTHISLNQESIQYVTSTEVFAGFDDHEIIPYNESKLSKYTLGGLIPGVIDAIINYSQAKEQGKPVISYIRDALEDIRYQQAFTENIKLKLQKVDWLKVREASLANSASNKMYDIYYSLSQAGTVLFVTTKYSFTDNFKALKIVSSIKLFPKNENLKSFAFSWSANEENMMNDNNCIYKNIIGLEKLLNQEVSTKEAAILLWANNNATLLREAINSGINDITQMIATDLNTIANKSASLARGELPRSP